MQVLRTPREWAREPAAVAKAEPAAVAKAVPVAAEAAPVAEADLAGDVLFTREELKGFNGVNGAPIYIALKVTAL